jgi:hypothetical protein
LEDRDEKDRLWAAPARRVVNDVRGEETVNAKNTFLSDPDAKVISAYGALSAQRVANRYYFLIDENGKLIWKSVTGQLIPVKAGIGSRRSCEKIAAGSDY